MTQLMLFRPVRGYVALTQLSRDHRSEGLNDVGCGTGVAT
ncbi:MAG: hypothetical protein JWR52_182 [Marmoricola sp.]|nr:hypothetical protein [Marmoricola sp.]